MFRVHTITALFCLLVVGCAFDNSQDPTESDAANTVGSAEQAATGKNPIRDAEYWGGITPPTGKTYLDMGVSSSTIYLSRSDGAIATYSRQNPPVALGTIAGSYQHLEMVESAPWNLIATNDTLKKIYFDAQAQGRLVGSYPTGVTRVDEIAAQAVSATRLNVWIVYTDTSVPSRIPTRLLRAGGFDLTSGVLSWQPMTVTWMSFNKGLTFGKLPNGSNAIVSIYDYSNSYFDWNVPGSLAYGYERNFAYTEHAYRTPSGSLDRLACPRLAYLAYDNAYYCLDEYATGSGVPLALVRLPVTALRP